MLLDVGGRVSYYVEIPDNNIAKLKKIQKLFMTDLALTIINSLKTAQKFISTRTFSVFPDVTKMNISMDDDSLAKYYNLNSEDKKSIVNQKEKEIYQMNKKNICYHFRYMKILQKHKRVIY